MDKSKFKALLKRYLTDNCTEEERQLVDSWYDLIGTEKPTVIEDLTGLQDRLWEKIQSSTAEQENPLTIHHLRKPKRKQWLYAAASILLLILAGSFFYLKQDTISAIANAGSNQSPPYLSKIENKSAVDKVIWLEDSSKVTLAPSSKLIIPEAFASQQKRVVELTGVAVFDVRKNPTKPFYVYTEDLVTRVLGTSFKVNSHSKKNIVVEVLTGKVSVYNKKQTSADKINKGNGVVLTPNQKVTYHAAQKHFITSVVDQPRLLSAPLKASKKPTFIYEETPIETVITEFEKNYGIQIEVDNNRFKDCPLTADLSNQSLFTKLDWICTSFNGTYTVQGTTILISGRGCN